jgi:WD40 repeat protein
VRNRRVDRKFKPRVLRQIQTGADNTERIILGHRDSVRYVKFSPDGQRVESFSSDLTGSVWDTESGREIIQANRGRLSPDGRRFVGIFRDNTARIWDAENGREIAHLQHEGNVESFAFSLDGRLIVTTSSDHTAHVWDAESGKEIARLQHEGDVRSATFSLDGHLVATTSSAPPRSKPVFRPKKDKTERVPVKYLQLWHTESGKEIGRLQPEGDVRSATFSPDGRLVMTTSSIGRQLPRVSVLQVWDTESRKEIARTKEGFLANAFFSADRQILLSDLDGWRVLEAESAKEIARIGVGYNLFVARSFDRRRLLVGTIPRLLGRRLGPGKEDKLAVLDVNTLAKWSNS